MATNNKNFKVKNGLDVGGNADVTGDATVAGKLSVTASSGDEGGEILLAKPATNTNLVGTGVTLDIYQNKLRFFEQGGDARGYYIDITGGGSAASTNLVGGGSASNSFTTINVPNGTDPSADSSTDTLNLADGANITITGDSSTDTVTVAVDADLTAINGITFDTTPTTPSTSAGTIFWDSGDGIPKAVLNANVTLGIGQESVLLVKNSTGSTLTKGSVVYINGAQGQNPTVALADADTEVTSSKTFGFVAESIADGAEGFVVTEGVLRGLNTDGLTEGGAIYLSSTAGQFTQTAPSEPAHLVFLGYVVKANIAAGEVIVKIQNGYELTELHGVLIENNGSLTDNEVLAYDTSTSLWKNQTASEAGLSVVGHTHLLADVTDVTASAAEVNILDGATLSTTELNYVDGVTSAIQTQIDGKAATNHTHSLANITDVTASAAEVNILDGATLTTTELNYVDGVTSAIQTQIDAKANTSDVAELARDAVGTALVAGSNITITPNDGADTITIAASNAPSYNFLINGGFDIWQRGTSSTTNNAYIADRWIHSRSAGTHTVSRSTDVPETTLQYSVSFASTSGTNPTILQRIEAANALPLVGQTVTFSIWAKSTVGTGALNWSTSFPETSADTFSALTSDQSGVFAATMTVGTWTRYSATFTVASGAVRGYQVSVFRNVTTTSTTTLYAGAQLELGSVVNSFKRNAPSIQAELAACQRYYVRFGSYGASTYIAPVGQVFNTVLAGWFIPLPVRMRATATADFSAASTFSASTASGGTTSAGSTVNLSAISIDMAYVAVGWASGQSLTAGHATVLGVSSTGFLGFNSEI